MRVAVVTDSTADLPADLAAELNISIIPTILVIDGKSYTDGPGISREDFYTRLPGLRTPPTTAAPAVGVYQELYASLKHSLYDQVVSIHLSGRMSGVLNAAKAAAQHFGKFVHLVDSGQVSMGLGFQVLAAAEKAAQGADIPEIIRAITDIQSRIHVMAMLDTLQYVLRSGRISRVRANLGELFQVKPFIELRDGGLVRRGEARTRRKGIERFYRYLAALGPLERLAILHSNAEADATQMASAFAAQVSQPPWIVNVTTIIGAHAGPNGLGFAAVVR